MLAFASFHGWTLVDTQDPFRVCINSVAIGDRLSIGARAAALLGSDVPEAARQVGREGGDGSVCRATSSSRRPCQDPRKAAFAEATRLLMAVVGFICEGQPNRGCRTAEQLLEKVP